MSHSVSVSLRVLTQPCFASLPALSRTRRTKGMTSKHSSQPTRHRRTRYSSPPPRQRSSLPAVPSATAKSTSSTGSTERAQGGVERSLIPASYGKHKIPVFHCLSMRLLLRQPSASLSRRLAHRSAESPIAFSRVTAQLTDIGAPTREV